MSLIFRAMLYSEQIPENLGIIFRKEYVDLRDSTVKDFEKYTGLKVSSQRDIVLSNKSSILFRHIEELNNIQNVNLGWFAIEQGDELETDTEFFLLFGRLRRAVEPTDYFKGLGLPERSGFVIGNAGDHWGKGLWKDGLLEESEYLEATTYENADVLPKDFLDGLEILKQQKPEIHRRFVLNDWNVSPNKFVIITNEMLDGIKSLKIHHPKTFRIVACDPAMGGDECVVYVLENGQIIDSKVMFERDTMKVAGELAITGVKHHIEDFIIDTIGIGQGIADRLQEMGKRVQYFNGAGSVESKQVVNKRDLAYWHTMQLIQDKKIEYPCYKDEELRRQLVNVPYRVVNSNGQIKLLPKDVIKKELGQSPDRADCYVMGNYGLKNVQPYKAKDAYSDESESLTFNPARV